MNTARLLLLADALETRIPADKFDLAYWRMGMRWGETSADAADHALMHTCGTSGCAIGWACALPEFKAEGLIWNAAQRSPDLAGLVMPPGQEYNRAWAAIEQFFKLEETVAEWLFLDDRYADEGGERLPGMRGGLAPSPEDVAHRIRHLLAGGTMDNHSFLKAAA